jgi:hypothetical protein
MHDIEPYHRWLSLYHPYRDEKSPYYGEEEDKAYYSSAVYNYLIHPAWDSMGSETLYLKILYANYTDGFMIIELMGEWNDALHNDIMYLKREIVDHFTPIGIDKFVIIGENVYNFHGDGDDYYQEWFEDLEEGWIVAIGFEEHVLKEWKRHRLDYYINFGGSLELSNWRTLSPKQLCMQIDRLVRLRLD